MQSHQASHICWQVELYTTARGSSAAVRASDWTESSARNVQSDELRAATCDMSVATEATSPSIELVGAEVGAAATVGETVGAAVQPVQVKLQLAKTAAGGG